MCAGEETDPILPKAVVYKRGAQPEVWRGALFATVFFPALGGLLFGYDIGATSYLLAQLAEPTLAGVVWASAVSDSALLYGCIASSGVGGAFVASFVIFRVADLLGRRGEMLCASCFFCVGASLEVAAGSYWAFDESRGLAAMLAGRALYGVGCGLAAHAAPTYISEMAPPALRGALVSFKEAMIVLGVLLGYSVGYARSEVQGGWLFAYAAAVPVAVVYGLGVRALPRSPRWLALKNRPAEASKALGWLYRDADAAHGVLLEILGESEELRRTATHDESLRAICKRSKATRAALKAGLGVVVLQQLTGQPTVLYYASTVLDGVGVSAAAPLAVAVVKLLATLYSCLVVERHGRRKLLVVGTSLMTVSLLALALAFALSGDTATTTTETEALYDDAAGTQREPRGGAQQSDESLSAFSVGATDALIIVALLGLVAGYSIGFGPIAWLLLSELFSSQVRGRAIALGVQLNFGANLLVSFLFPTMIAWLGDTATFFIFALLAAYSAHFVRHNVPETRSMTLEQIQRLLGDDLLDEHALDAARDAALDDDAPPHEPPYAGVALPLDAGVAVPLDTREQPPTAAVREPRSDDV